MPAANLIRALVAVVVGLFAVVRTTTSGAARSFYLADYTDGRIRLDGLDRNARDLIRCGFVLLTAILTLLMVGDWLRTRADLLVVGTSAGGRPVLVPEVLPPLTMFLLVFAWTFVLTGALHCGKGVAAAAWALYTVVALGWLNTTISARQHSPLEFWVSCASVVAVAVVFAARRRTAPRPALEFAILFPLTAVVYLVAQYIEEQNQRRFGMSLGMTKIAFNVNCLRGLIAPLLLMIGVSIADFVRRVSHWTANVARHELPRWITLPVFTCLFAWRVLTAVDDLADPVTRAPWHESAGSVLGAAGALGLTFLVLEAVRRLSRRKAPTERGLTTAAMRWVFPLVSAYSLISVTVFLLLASAMALPNRGVFAPAHARLLSLVDWGNEHAAVPWHYLLSVGVLGVAYYQARRGRSAIAAYLGLFGAMELWLLLTRSAGPLGMLAGRDDAWVELGWLLIFGATVARQLIGRRFRDAYRLNLPFLLLLLTFMRQRDFIENPFTPLLGFTGVAFVAFGLLWDLATQGRWANGDSPALPRVGRLMLYLGYALLAATVLNWAVTAHNLDVLNNLTGGTALLGFDHFGKPLLYGVFGLCLMRSRHV